MMGYYAPTSAPHARCVVDFAKLPVDTLLRYVTRFGIQLPPTALPRDIANAVAAHFEVHLDVEEDDALARFVNTARRSGVKGHPRPGRPGMHPTAVPVQAGGGGGGTAMMGQSLVGAVPAGAAAYDSRYAAHLAATGTTAGGGTTAAPMVGGGGFVGMAPGGGAYGGMDGGVALPQGAAYGGVPMGSAGMPAGMHGSTTGATGASVSSGMYAEDSAAYTQNRKTGGAGVKRRRPSSKPSSTNRAGADYTTTSNYRGGEEDTAAFPSSEVEEQYIACDHPKCPTEWYPLSQVGLTPETIPSGKWYCPRCRKSISDHTVPLDTPRTSFPAGATNTSSTGGGGGNSASSTGSGRRAGRTNTSRKRRR